MAELDDSRVDRVLQMTTTELHAELSRKGFRQYVVATPAYTKSQLVSKYIRYLLRKHKSGDTVPKVTNATRPSISTNEDNVAQPTISTNEATIEDVADEDEDDEDEDDNSRVPCVCNLKNVLNWIVRILYTFALAAVSYELLLEHWENSREESAALSVAPSNGLPGPNPASCLTALVIVFGTYLIMHNALEVTSTSVYWIQVIVSLFWIAFLALLMTVSLSCPAVGYHIDVALEFCGLTDEAELLLREANQWFIYFFVPRKGGANFIV
eukprot:INCI17499.1.p1 GENE.INCI17499.1~~INCI17499.1.p1  ORF type:complete len:304 (+),score=43.27 INCI17499.1:111-914(+)